MNGITPFTLPVGDLVNLGPDRAVEFFRRFLWVEAARVGIGRNLIDVPDCINVGDGGIDAFIKDAQPSTDEIIPNGTTGFQIKSKDLGPGPTPYQKELHQGGNLSKSIKPEIKRILDQGGTYVLVLLADITTQQKTKREEAIREELNRLGYRNPIRLYTANQLAGFAERFPALVAWLKNDRRQCLFYSSWSERSDVAIPKRFVFDEDRKKWMADVRQGLRNPDDQCRIYRMTGLSGIGKTRFVFETLSPDDLKNRVVYARAEEFRFSDLYLTLQNDQNLSAIVVIDECDLQRHDEFVRSFAGRGSKLAVFTLSHDMGTVPSPALPYKLERLSREAIEEILKTEAPGLPGDVIRRLSQFADGYPRIAVLLSESYLANREGSENFLTISDDNLINQLINGRQMDSRTTRRVLQGLSLFRKVGYEGGLSKESEWVAELVMVDWYNFQEVVAEQRRRGIIQGHHYIYVTPFMLRIHLLKEWWESHGLTKENFNEFVGSIPEQFKADLLERFFDHIPYITTTARGKEFAESVLGESGLFANGSALEIKVGADFFLKLAEADPDSALKCLMRTVGTWDKAKLLQFTIGRREVVWALGNIAMWRELFADAVRLLLALGEAENESYLNSASGVFAGLFSPGPGRVAPTEASPQERLPILIDSFESGSKEQRTLALKACDQALESRNFFRFTGSEHQGLRKAPQLWMPQTYGEIYDAYRQVWQLLRERLELLPEDERQEAVDILLRHARGLGEIPNLADMVIETVKELASKPYGDRKKILETVAQILHYDGQELPSETRKRWEQLRDELIGDDFHSVMRRYVGMNVLVDKFDEQENYGETHPRIRASAQQAVENNELLRPELDWLVTTEAENGYSFGYELGIRDKAFSLLPMLLEAQRNANENASVYFLGGYFRALFEKNQKKWEDQLVALAKDTKLNIWIPELTQRSGLSDRVGLCILSLAQKGVIGIDRFGVFIFGTSIRNLSEAVFKKWIEFLLDASDSMVVSIALNLYDFYYLRKKEHPTLPFELTWKLLAHQALFQKSETRKFDQMVDYHWAKIGKAFVQRYPKRSLELADKMLEHLGESGTIVDGFHSEPQSLLTEITRQHPEEVWKRITQYLDSREHFLREFFIKEWLQGAELRATKEESALTLIPREEIWEWVDKDVEKRSSYLASFVPKTLSAEEWKTCLARDVLGQYGEREAVRKNLMGNFSSGVWAGLASLRDQELKQKLLNVKEREDNENVKRWIDEYASWLDWHIEHAKIEEERRGF